jgi:hypothetical protein
LAIKEGRMNGLIADPKVFSVESQGKIIGVIAGRREFQTLCEVFAAHSVYRLVCTASDPGINYLESEHDTNTEIREIIGKLGAAHSACYMLAANTGMVVFAANLAVDEIASMIEVARSLGATSVMEVKDESTLRKDFTDWNPIACPPFNPERPDRPAA